ncbi:MAG TPA: DNA translocase FtsK 4TM domain-containing protein, partial [Gammaproteobacteria bacterium]|nr:DNA translocase FtsK 4TM domain-containing protein [Gammaproteobacteria bacterium]
MKQASQNKLAYRPIGSRMAQRLREGAFILSAAFSLFLLISFASYHSTDPGWSSTGIGNTVFNWGGRAGGFFADAFLSLFGWMAYLLVPMIAFAGWVGVQRNSEESLFQLGDFIFKMIGFIFIIISGCGLIALSFTQHVSYLPANSGGIFGDLVASHLTYVFNRTGSALFLIAALLCNITLYTGFSWVGFIDWIGQQAMRWPAQVWQEISRVPVAVSESFRKKPDTAPVIKSAIPARYESKVVEPKVVEPVRPPKLRIANKKIESSVILSSGNL